MIIFILIKREKGKSQKDFREFREKSRLEEPVFLVPAPPGEVRDPKDFNGFYSLEYDSTGDISVLGKKKIRLKILTYE